MSEPAPEALPRTPRYTEAAQPSRPASEAAPRAKWLSAAAWLRDLMLAVLIAVLVVLFLYRPVRVEGTSMLPSLHNQERLFINEFGYRFGLEQIRRGDTIVFWYPEDTTKSYIKRVIGLPGDRVQIVQGKVYVNGRRLVEPYVLPRYRDPWSYPEVVVPAHHYFVLGDHRNSSNDSRSWGCLDRDFIYGKASFAYWPMDRVGLVH